MDRENTRIIEKVQKLAEQLLQEKEIELVDIVYRKEGSHQVLRLIVDKKEGITLDECSWVNERLGSLLDKEDFLIERYTLEVSSPGLDRPLRTKRDFERVKDKVIRVHTYGPVEDQREHVGKTVSCDDECVTIALKDGNTTRSIPLKQISKAKLEIEF